MHTEIQRRRTFAIISHPDAGKTTLTEKLLLYGGAVQLAGSVTARKQQRATASDWMEMERKRGISVTSSVMQFEYGGCVINLLDTPGHHDFSEDTYRVLTAVDAAIMVIDAGKGIESQTRKLFEVCRKRGLPIFTFFNKMDRPARAPLELLDELEETLGIGGYPVTWPLGAGETFRGVYHRRDSKLYLYERTAHGTYRAPEQVAGLQDPAVAANVDSDALTAAAEELEMLEAAGQEFDPGKVDAGELTPAFFGSAVNNFGIQLLLDAFLEMAPPPRSRRSSDRQVEAGEEAFSGFVFKIQANMDPKHRDRLFFIRVVSGRFDRDMQVILARTGRTVRLANSQKLFARERSTVNEAFPGDIVGLVGNQDFQIGDTLAEDASICFDEIPSFSPEHFAILENPNTAKFKQFRTGLDQLLREGAVQHFQLEKSLRRVPLLGAVGPLQFEVVQYRLQHEYGVESRLEPAPWRVVRWIDESTPLEDGEAQLPTGTVLARDPRNRPVVLFEQTWQPRLFQERNPGILLLETPAHHVGLSSTL